MYAAAAAPLSDAAPFQTRRRRPAPLPDPAANVAPVVGPLRYKCAPNATLTVGAAAGLLSTCRDANVADTCRLSGAPSLSVPAAGTLEGVNSTSGAFVFRPAPGFVGSTAVRFNVTDGKVVTAAAAAIVVSESSCRVHTACGLAMMRDGRTGGRRREGKRLRVPCCACRPPACGGGRRAMAEHARGERTHAHHLTAGPKQWTGQFWPVGNG